MAIPRIVEARTGPARDPESEVPVAGDTTNRVGDVEVAHGEATVMLILHGSWPGAAQLTPDDADALADRLRHLAAHVRRVNAVR